jgi:hypothetical protein
MCRGEVYGLLRDYLPQRSLHNLTIHSKSPFIIPLVNTVANF